MKRAELSGRSFRRALVVADSMLDEEISMPSDVLNWLDNVIVKRPEPEYASMRWLIL